MYVRRDSSRSFFNGKSRTSNHHYGRWLFVLGLMVGMIGVFVMMNRDTLEAQALDLMGLAPTPTPLPSDLASLGNQLMVQGNLQEARNLFESALAQRPDNIAYRYEYGRLMIEMNEPLIAREQGESILQINPSEPRGYALRAMAEVAIGNYNTAIPIAIAGLDLRAGYESHLYSALARAYTNSGQYQNGVDAGAMAIMADPTDANSRRSYAFALSWVRDNDTAIEQLEAAILLDPTNISAYMELALQYLAHNRDQEAINIYDRVLAIQPNNARAMRRLCGTYRKIGQFERARGFCEDSVRTDPMQAGAWYELGLLQYNALDMADAVHSFEQCVAVESGNYTCKHRLGLAYYYVEECDLAWTTLQESLEMTQAAQVSGASVGDILRNIQLGLQQITLNCDDYRGQLTPDNLIEPEIESEDEGLPADAISIEESDDTPETDEAETLNDEEVDNTEVE